MFTLPGFALLSASFCSTSQTLHRPSRVNLTALRVATYLPPAAVATCPIFLDNFVLCNMSQKLLRRSAMLCAHSAYSMRCIF